jgi:thermostable 8-oxoguanine DNA glycosylase
VPPFTLQFPLSEVASLAARYSYAKNDAECQEAGKVARERGHYTPDEFMLICEWKTARSKRKVAANRDSMVVASTQRALAATDEMARMEALLGLEGVGVPTASALLFFAFPTDYPILDYRALESLGQPTNRTTYSATYWLRYLEVCRSLAAEAQVPIRTLDKALWQASTERSTQAAC